MNNHKKDYDFSPNGIKIVQPTEWVFLLGVPPMAINAYN